jgi:MYXO-CTERM domain-containing protein
VVANISSLYPATCQGAASCACVGGVKACSPTCTAWNARVAMFAPGTGGEIIAGGSDPDGAFYLWLNESYSKSTCAYDQGPPTNGHRWNILKSNGAVGVGFSGPAVGDFGSGPALGKIPSGTHYPQQASSIEMWVNWYDTAGPKSAMVNIDGQCQPLSLKRGSQPNGAWSATVTGLGSGCHRYFFLFQDQAGATVSYPTTGSLAIGPAASCPSYAAGWPQTAACNIAPPPNGGMGGGGTTDDGGTSGGGGDGGAGDGGAVDGGTVSGCGCHVGGGQAEAPLGVGLGLLFGLGFWASHQARRRRTSGA